METEAEGAWPGRALIDRLVACLDEGQASLWRGLHFMEANGIDFSLRYEELHAGLTDEDRSPLANPQCLPHAWERALVLALRDVVRRDLGLPPLTAEERRDWVYERQEPFRWHPDQLLPRAWPESVHPAPGDVAALKDHMSGDHPQVMRALVLAAANNVRAEGRPEKLFSVLWLLSRLNATAAALRPDLNSVDVHGLVMALLDDIRRGAEEDHVRSAGPGAND